MYVYSTDGEPVGFVFETNIYDLDGTPLGGSSAAGCTGSTAPMSANGFATWSCGARRAGRGSSRRRRCRRGGRRSSASYRLRAVVDYGYPDAFPSLRETGYIARSGGIRNARARRAVEAGT